LILGGAGFSLLPEALMKRLGADFGIIGEGEVALPFLLRAIIRKEEMDSYPGICRRLSDGTIKRARIEPAWELRGIDKKGWEKINTARYYRAGGMIGIQTKRGCQSRCLYCTYPGIEGTRVRVRPPFEVVDEIEDWIEGSGIKQFFFVDSVFNYPVEHCESILSEVCRRGLRMGWTAYINPRFLTPDLVRLMARSGCTGVELGVDSGSDRILDNLRKDFSSRDVVRAISLFREERIPSCASLILGGPGESPQSLDESFALMDSCRVNVVFAMVGIRVYPGCALYNLCLEEGRIVDEDTLIEPFFYLSSELGELEIMKIFQEARTRGNWILPGGGINYDEKVLQKLRSRDVKGPLWRFVRKWRISFGSG